MKHEEIHEILKTIFRYQICHLDICITSVHIVLTFVFKLNNYLRLICNTM